MLTFCSDALSVRIFVVVCIILLVCVFCTCVDIILRNKASKKRKHKGPRQLESYFRTPPPRKTFTLS